MKGVSPWGEGIQSTFGLALVSTCSAPHRVCNGTPVLVNFAPVACEAIPKSTAQTKA